MLKPTLFMSFLSFDPGEQASDFELKTCSQWKDKSTWDMIQIFIFSFFAVLARRRTHAHASA